MVSGLMAVLLSVAVGAMLIPRISSRGTDGKVAAAYADLDMLDSATLRFRLDCGRFPSTAEGISALVTAPAKLKKSWKGPYLLRPVGNDPWGRPYEYVLKSPDHYVLLSHGPPDEEDGRGVITVSKG